MHLALIEAMYKLEMIGKWDENGKGSSTGTRASQGNEVPEYFVVGVDKEEWKAEGNNDFHC